jgi:hypothetical protein
MTEVDSEMRALDASFKKELASLRELTQGVAQLLCSASQVPMVRPSAQRQLDVFKSTETDVLEAVRPCLIFSWLLPTSTFGSPSPPS